jgi:hypothetical protein
VAKGRPALPSRGTVRSRDAPGGMYAGAAVPRALHGLLPLVLVALWARSINGIDPEAMTDHGLISVMPATSLLLVLTLSLSFSVALARGASSWVVLSHVLVLIVMLYGVTAFIEPEPRFQTVWKHVGIIDYIERHRSVDPSLDAYFNWPGFFVLGAVITKAAGLTSPLALAAWGPLVFNLLFLAPLVVIFRSVSDDPRVVWLGVWIFFSASWVGQDYIAPQAVAYLIWLSIAAIVLTGFLRAPADRGPALQRGGFALVVIVMFGAIVTGHQLTPFAVLLSLGALAIFTRLVARGLVWVMAIIEFAWIAYMATTYLAGHIDEITHPLGSVGSNVETNVGGRIVGSPAHALIVQMRIAASAAILLLAMAGFVQQRHAWRRTTPLIVLAAAPFILPILQPYGGEMLLRVFLFALPGVAFLAAHVALPSQPTGRRWRLSTGVAIVTCPLLVTFQFTRYGNERLDSFTRGDVRAVQALYRVAPRGSVLFAGSYNLPWRYRNYADYDYRAITGLAAWRRNPNATGTVLAAIRASARGRPAYVIFTRSTTIASELLEGTPSATLQRFVVRLSRARRSMRQLYQGRDGLIFFVRGT